MKIPRFLAVTLVAAAVDVHAADITKFSSGTNLSAAASWGSGAGPVPASTDVAVWDAGSTASGLTLGANQSWQGIKVNAGGPADIVISGGNTLTLGSSGIDMSGAAADLTFSGFSGVTLSASQTWNPGTHPLVITGRTTAAGGTAFNLGGFTLTKQGTGAFTITTGTTISNGTLVVSAGSLTLTSASSSTLTFNAGLTVVAGATLTTAGNSSGVVLAGAGTVDGSWSISTTGTTTVNAAIGGSGSINISQSGTLSLGTAGSLAGHNLAVNSGTLQINRSGTEVQSTFTAGGNGFQNALTGSAKFTKSNTGTFTLDRANTYTGATTVSNGRLIAANAGVAGTNGALGNGGLVTVNGSSAVLQIGNGTVVAVANVGSINVSSGKLDMTGGGTDAVTLTLAAGKVLTMSSGTGLLFANTGSSINLNGGTAGLTGIALDLGNRFNAAGTYHLITGGTVTTTGYSVLNFDSVNYSQTFGNGDLVVTAVPEPSTYGLIGAGVLAGVTMVRRRRRLR